MQSLTLVAVGCVCAETVETGAGAELDGVEIEATRTARGSSKTRPLLLLAPPSATVRQSLG